MTDIRSATPDPVVDRLAALSPDALDRPAGPGPLRLPKPDPSPPRNETPIDHPPGLSEDRAMPPHDFDQAEPMRGRAARHPRRIPVLGWRDILWRTFREISVDRLPAVAGGVTFYTLLAIFPAIGAFVSLYGLFADVGRSRSSCRRCRRVSRQRRQHHRRADAAPGQPGTDQAGRGLRASACCCRSGAPTPA
jgi:hypothetical protein